MRKSDRLLSVKFRAAGLTLLAVLLWGAAPVANRYLVGDVHAGLPALPLVALRYGVILPVFVAVAVWGRVWAWPRADLGLAAVCAVLGVTGYNIPNVVGTRTVSAGMVGLLNGAEPLMILLLMAARDRRMPGVWALLAGAVGLAGIVLLAESGGPVLGDAPGIALVLFAALAWSVYCVIVPPLLRRRGAGMVTAVTMSIGTVPMLGAGAAGLPSMVATLSPVQWEILAALSCSAVIAIFCWNAGNDGLGAAQAGWFLYLLPVVSVAGGAWILHEPVTGVELLGGALIMVSVLMSQKWGRTA